MKFRRLLAVILAIAVAFSLTACSELEIIVNDILDVLDEASSTSSVAYDEITVYYFDVGQGDSELIVSGDNAILIDSGENSEEKRLIGYLNDLGINKIDYVVATHPHSDHIGGLDGIIKTFDVKNVMAPRVTNTTAAYENMLKATQNKGLKIQVPKVGDVIEAGDIQMTVLAPNADKYDDLNNYSIVLRLEYNNTAFMFTGDAEALSESEILVNSTNIRSNVLKVGHHGSVSSTSNEFLNSVAPEIAIISCGAGNTYGHPHKETMEKLQKKDITVYRTDLTGTIILKTDGNNVSYVEE